MINDDNSESQDYFRMRSIRESNDEIMSALYLQVSIISQALIFVTRSHGWSYMERPGFLLVTAFCCAQLVGGLAFIYMTCIIFIGVFLDSVTANLSVLFDIFRLRLS